MPKSDLARALDEIQGLVAPELKARKFRSRGRTFNRPTSDGLTHVFNIQMGSFDPPGTTYHPGLRENLYGRFTVNLGVYVPEVASFHGGGPPKSWIQDYNCCLRTRLGALGLENKDLWWSIRARDEVLDDLLPRVSHDAMRYFATYTSRDQILSALEGKSQNTSAGGPPRIICAIILAQRGNTSQARELLKEQARETRNPGHPAYVRALAERLGLGGLDV